MSKQSDDDTRSVDPNALKRIRSEMRTPVGEEAPKPDTTRVLSQDVRKKVIGASAPPSGNVPEPKKPGPLKLPKLEKLRDKVRAERERAAVSISSASPGGSAGKKDRETLPDLNGLLAGIDLEASRKTSPGLGETRSGLRKNAPPAVTDPMTVEVGLSLDMESSGWDLDLDDVADDIDSRLSSALSEASTSLEEGSSGRLEPPEEADESWEEEEEELDWAPDLPEEEALSLLESSAVLVTDEDDDAVETDDDVEVEDDDDVDDEIDRPADETSDGDEISDGDDLTASGPVADGPNDTEDQVDDPSEGEPSFDDDVSVSEAENSGILEAELPPEDISAQGAGEASRVAFVALALIGAVLAFVGAVGAVTAAAAVGIVALLVGIGGLLAGRRSESDGE